eukprot:6187951-Pleurochrysis_carterae.AAC.2
MSTSHSLLRLPSNCIVSKPSIVHFMSRAAREAAATASKCASTLTSAAPANAVANDAAAESEDKRDYQLAEQV